MKEQIAELEDRHRKNNLRFNNLRVKSETWKENKTKPKFFCKKNWI